MTDRCEIARCRADADLSYLGHGVCSRHWTELTNENAPADALRKALGIEAAPEPSMEEIPMSSKKKAETKTDAKPEKAAKKREPKPDKSDCAPSPFASTRPISICCTRRRAQESQHVHQVDHPGRGQKALAK